MSWQRECIKDRDKRIAALEAEVERLTALLALQGEVVPTPPTITTTGGLPADTELANLREVCQRCVDSPAVMCAIMDRERITIDNHGDPMQKMAFTLYTRLAVLAQAAESALEGKDARPGYANLRAFWAEFWATILNEENLIADVLCLFNMAEKHGLVRLEDKDGA